MMFRWRGGTLTGHKTIIYTDFLQIKKIKTPISHGVGP